MGKPNALGHPARNRKSKPLVSPLRKDTTVAATEGTEKSVLCQPGGLPPVPQREANPHGPLAGLNLSESEWDTLFCLAIKDHFEREQVWVPSVLRTMALLEGINDKTGRPCRIYVLPNKRIVMVETLS
jgi:hypothetical protein